MLGKSISDLVENWLEWINQDKTNAKSVIHSEKLIKERYSNIDRIDSEINDKTRIRNNN